MDGMAMTGEEPRLQPPPRIFEKLRQIGGYTWDETRRPFHTSYDNWHVYGTKIIAPKNTSVYTAKSSSGRHSPISHTRSKNGPARSEDGSEATSTSHDDSESSQTDIPVVARISTHALREERAFHICKSLIKSVDPQGIHIVRPLDLIRLPSQQGEKGSTVVAIFESAGRSILPKLIDFGPAYYYAPLPDEVIETEPDLWFTPSEQVTIPMFLDFAIGATECLEILHHGQRIVHGELRGDAFHFNATTGRVKLINFGSGLRSFEHGLTSSGWSTLSKEQGAKTKLSYISPEQTGRMPAEPDSRTDIYSLGILFWTLLAQRPAFDGDTPMDIIQGVLGRRIPTISSIRLDVPDAIGRIIQRMTAKSIGDRYHSASGLHYDLVEVQKLLGNGDIEALNDWKIATRDVSSFFILPTDMIGRQKEHDEIVKVIDKVAKRHTIGQKRGLFSLSSNSSISADGRMDVYEIGDASSEGGTSSAEGLRKDSSTQSVVNFLGDNNKYTKPNGLPASSGSQQNSMDSPDPSSIPQFKPWEKNSAISAETRSSDGFSIEGDNSECAGALSKDRNSTKFRRKGRCEIVAINGAAGLGKSCLVHSVQVEARRRGYFASAKFDQAAKTPFGPVLKLLSSLFKQVFSESQTDTPFHQLLKQFVRPTWPMLHRVLGLPEFLLGSAGRTPRGHSINRSLGFRSIRSDFERRNSSPGGSSHNSASLGTQGPQDFLRAGSSTKSVRLMNTVLDVLRVFSYHKFICFCLDDLQYADEESIELLAQIVSSKMKMVIILTYRPGELLPERIKDILDSANTEAAKNGNYGVTQVVLRPLSEDDIVQFVASTLRRPKDEIIPLAVVIQAKTAGNPFYMREMLDACHRKQCIWYDYKESRWHYDLDRIYKHFQTKDYSDILDANFVTRRLAELPPASRSILAWASLLGTSFSFELVQRLLCGEFDYDRPDTPDSSQQHSLTHPAEDAVGGLQAAIQAYVLVASEDDDRFRFAHDRYQTAAAALGEYNGPKMHFIIAQTLMKYYGADERSKDVTASHICECLDVIRQQVVHRYPFRKLLFECAQSAAESGARPTATKYYSNCFALLQDDPWIDGVTDVYYDETLQLYTRAAECYHYIGQQHDASFILSEVNERARTAVDKAPCWVLSSRLLAQKGDASGAFSTLKKCLVALGISVADTTTFEKCDTEYDRLTKVIAKMDRNSLFKSVEKDSNLAAIGAVLVETTSAAFWTDHLAFYQMALVMINVHLTNGSFPQSGMGWLHLGSIAISRFNNLHLGNEFGNIAMDLMDRWRDPYTLGRGGTIYALFIGHIQYPLSASVGQLEGTLEYTIQAGDRISTILNFGLVATLKFFSSEPLGDIESFCQFGCEEIPNWELDSRGGTMLVSIRQACRALQGKTITDSASEVMSDEFHSTALYMSWIRTTMKDSSRPISVYQSIMICPLFLYGHYVKAVELGRSSYERVEVLWSSRQTRFTIFYYGLSLAGLVWSKLQDPLTSKKDVNVQETMSLLKVLNQKIIDWQEISDVNYLAWSKLLSAQIAEMQGDHGIAIKCYEESLDHASSNGFVSDEALGNYLQAGFFLRRQARRPAKAALREATMLYRQFGAIGVARYIETIHSLLLQGPTHNLRVADVAVQTDFAGESGEPASYQTLEGDDSQVQPPSIETKGDRIGAWQGSSARQEAGIGLPALDMLDLTSILESSQVISSVLQIDQLLKTMCDIIMQNCGGLASLAAIVVEEDDPSGWSVAASADPEKGAFSHIPGLPLAEAPFIAENVILYTTRFRETVFLPDLMHDERFSNVSDAWAERHPDGKSIIALPICHGSKPLLGVLYLEGQPNAFTDRNLTVLQLLVNQVGISYSNALTLKAIEKVSASNISMVESQKRALTKAKDAEAKAKRAEAEALRNVKLAEEAAKAKSIFLANVSHELRTPLNGVIGNSELLRDSELRKEQAEMADSIRVSADLLLTVINDILDFSKMEADKMKLFIVAFNADEMLREVIRSVSYSNQNKRKSSNVQIITDVHLPKSLIFGDPVRLHQVIGNLIGNSLKFTEAGSITIGARTDWETRDSLQLTFWVKDTGIGIPPQQLAKLFRPFSQADASTARKYGGSGLGLSICKSLIESMMGGRIELDSQENVGTTAWFTVIFNKADGEATAGDSQEEGTSRETAAARLRDDEIGSSISYTDFSEVPREALRICIAEDNPINQKIAIQFVQKLGFLHVDAYDNGLSAVEGMRAKAKEGIPYHLVLMDVQMPVLDGYEATKLLRRDPLDAVRGVLVIAMTASAIQGDREKCLESGMNDYLAKPVRVGILKRKLEQYLNQPPRPIPNLQQEANRLALSVMSDISGPVSPPITSPVISKPLPPIQREPPPSSAQLNKPLPPVRSKEWKSGPISSDISNDVNYKIDQRNTEAYGVDRLSINDLSPKSMPLGSGKDDREALLHLDGVLGGNGNDYVENLPHDRTKDDKLDSIVTVLHGSDKMNGGGNGGGGISESGSRRTIDGAQ